MKTKITFLKTVIVALAVFNATNIFSQLDSTSFYNNGVKEWFYIQKDVYVFRAVNGQAYSGAFDPAVVDHVDHKNNSPRQINEMHFKQSATEPQRNVERNKVRGNPNYECEFPVLTKEPTKNETHNEWKATDDLLLVAFSDPNISQADITQFKVQNDLILERQPSNSLPQTQSWTYTFRVPYTKCGTTNAVEQAKIIWENNSAILKYIVPNMRSIKIDEFATNSNSSFTSPNPTPTSSCILPNDYSRFQWWADNDGTVNYVPGGGTALSTANADPSICECWNSGYKGNGIKIAVMDFHGFQLNHEDINGQFLNGWNTINNTPLVTTTIVDATQHHGQAVSGIIGAIANNSKGIIGVAYESKIIPILMSGWENEVIMGLQKAIEYNADVINMSFEASFFTSAVQSEITNVSLVGRPDPWNSSIKYGCVMVAGAGNTNTQIARYPAAYAEVIGVGGSNPNDFRSSSTDGWGWASGGSNYGVLYDVVAPSSFMRSMRYMGTGGSGISLNYNLDLQGTSFGTPIVSGIAAILLQKNPGLYASFLENTLRNTADKVNSATYNYNYNSLTPGRSLEMQYGRVNCINALINTAVGVNEIIKNNISLSSYYNGNGELIVTYDLKDITQATIILYDVLGKEILQEKLPLNQNKITLSISELSQGVYFLNAVTNKGSKLGTQKFIKY